MFAHRKWHSISKIVLFHRKFYGIFVCVRVCLKCSFYCLLKYKSVENWYSKAYFFISMAKLINIHLPAGLFFQGEVMENTIELLTIEA